MSFECAKDKRWFCYSIYNDNKIFAEFAPEFSQMKKCIISVNVYKLPIRNRNKDRHKRQDEELVREREREKESNRLIINRQQ